MKRPTHLLKSDITKNRSLISQPFFFTHCFVRSSPTFHLALLLHSINTVYHILERFLPKIYLFACLSHHLNLFIYVIIHSAFFLEDLSDILKSYSLSHLLLFYLSVFWLQGMWDLSSHDWEASPQAGGKVLTLDDSGRPSVVKEF